MASERKLLANRKNAQKSRGPMTAEGKARSCRNSLRHGLNLINRHHPQYADAIENIAADLCGAQRDAELWDHAMTIAECDLLLASARAEAALVTDRLRDPTVLSHMKGKKSILSTLKANFRRCKDYDKLYALYTDTLRPYGTEAKRKKRAKELFTAFWGPAARSEAEAIEAAAPDLIRLERYMRRAWSRRRKALRAFLLRLKELTPAILPTEFSGPHDGEQNDHLRPDQHLVAAEPQAN